MNETHRIYLYGEHEFLKIQKDNFSELLHNELINCILLISKELQALNLFNQYNSINYNNLIESGARGLGKSEIAVTIGLYLMHRLMCLKDPHEFLNLNLNYMQELNQYTYMYIHH